MKTKDAKRNIKTRKKSELIITFLGYFWIIFSVIVSVWQLIDFLFHPTISSPWTIILCCIVPILSVAVAVILTLFFPIFLSRLDICGSDEKYFALSSAEQLQNLQSTLYMCVSGDDERLLTSLKRALQEKKYDDAVKIGRNNSRILHVYGKNSLRFINGVYSYYALAKQLAGKKYSLQEGYIKNYFLINDIGLCLIKFTAEEVDKLKLFVDTDEYFKEVNRIWGLDFQSKINDLNQRGYSVCEEVKKEMSREPKYYKLIAQAIRHQLYYSIKNNYGTEIVSLTRDFHDAVNKIDNRYDRLEMEAYLNYINALTTTRRDNLDENKLAKALAQIEEAKISFEKIGDELRAAKCFYIKAELLLSLSKIKGDAKMKKLGQNCLIEGANYSVRVARFEEAVKNLKLLTACSDSDDDLINYARNELQRLGRQGD